MNPALKIVRVKIVAYMAGSPFGDGRPTTHCAVKPIDQHGGESLAYYDMTLNDAKSRAARLWPGLPVDVEDRRPRLVKWWPRGKYNGRRIGGFEIRVRWTFFFWHWKPCLRLSFGQPSFHWLGLNVWAETAYEDRIA